MKILAVIANTVMLFGAAVSQSKADAIYEWRGDPSSSNPSAMSLKLVISDDAFKAGNVNFTYLGQNAVGARASSTDVQELSWSYSGGLGFQFVYEPAEASYTAINVNLNLSPSGYATGSINFGSDFMDLSVTLQSNADGLFSMTSLAYGAVAYNPYNCGPDSGCPVLPTGTIQKVADIPEPGSLSLISLGLVAFSRLARRRKA